MKSDDWNGEDAQVIEKTGKPIAHWIKALDRVKATDRKSNDVVVHLQADHDASRYWARTLTTL